METVTRDVMTMPEITHLHCVEQNKLTLKPTHQSKMEKEQVAEITPIIAIQSLKGNEDTQIIKTIKATVVTVALQPLEHQQVVEVENVRMSLEKAAAVKENIYDAHKDLALDGREPLEEIIVSKEDQSDMEETSNKDEVDGNVGMGHASVFKTIFDDIEVVEKGEAGALEVSPAESDEEMKEKDTVEETDTVQRCLCEQETEDTNAAEAVGKVSEPSEEQERETASEIVQAEIGHSTEEATLTLKLQKEDSVKSFARHTDASEDAKGTSQLETDRLNLTAEPTEKVQEMEMTQNDIVTVEVMDKMGNNSIEEIEEMAETEKRVITTDVDSELTTDGEMERFQEEKSLKVIKTVQDTQVEEIKSKDITEASEDDQINLSEEEEDNANFVTQLRCSRRMKHQAEERELTKSDLRSSGKTAKPKIIKQQVKTKQDIDSHKAEQMEDVGKSHTGTVVEEVIESGLNESAINDNVKDQVKVTSAEDFGETTKHDEEVAVPVTEDVEAADTAEPFTAESVEEQGEEPISERLSKETENNTEEVFELVDFNKDESDNMEISKGTSEPQDEVVQEVHKPKSTEHRKEGEVKQTEGEAELCEKEHEVEMTKDEHEKAEEERDEKMETDENIMSKVEDKVPESAFTDDDEGLKSDEQIELSEEEQDKTSCAIPLRRSRRRRHQVAKSELRKRVLRSATKAAEATSKTKAVKQHMETKLSVDEPEVEQIKEVLESHTETAVKEKIESESISTELEHVKAVEIEVEGKLSGQSAAEPGEEQEEEPASETSPAEDENTEEATSGLILQKVAGELVDFDKVSTTPTDAVKDDKVPSQSQKEVDLELHKPEATDSESQAKNTEEEQVVENKIRNSGNEKTDEKLQSEEGVALTDEEMEDPQRETDTAQEIQTEESQSLESSEEDEGERAEDDEKETSSVTLLRSFKRLKDQNAESKTRRRVLRRSARLTDKATLQERHKQQIKTMMIEKPEQIYESKNDDVNNIVWSAVAPGERMESETVQGSSKERSNLEKVETEIDDLKSIKNVKIPHGIVGEENISSEDVSQQDKMPLKHIIHGENEQVSTSGEKSDGEVVKEIEDKVQDEGTAEMVHGEDSENLLMLKEASVVLEDVGKVPLDLRDDCSSAFETEEMSQQVVEEYMPEELKEELQSKSVEEEDIEIESVNLPERHSADLNTAANDTAEEGSSVIMSNVEDDTSELVKKTYSVEMTVDEESKTKQSTQQEPNLTKDSVLKICSETATDMQNVFDLHDTELVKDDIFVEEQEEELATELVLEEDRENVVESTSMVNLHKPAVVLVDFQRQADGNGTNGNERTRSQDVALRTMANEEKALIEMDGTKPVTVRKEEAAASELGTDNKLLKNDEQERDILAEEGVKDHLKEVEDITLKEKTDLNSNKTPEEYQESATPAQGYSDQESTQNEGTLVNTSRNIRHMTLQVKATAERKTRHLQNMYKETKVNEESSEEAVFIRHLRRRTIIVTPIKTSKNLSDTQEAAMEALVSHEIVADARTAVKETHETTSKCDSEDSEVTRKDQQHDNNVPENDTEWVEELSDGGKDMVEEATDREIQVEGDLLDKNQEKKEADEPSQEYIRSANSKQESVQQEGLLMLLKETFEEDLDKSLEEHTEGEKDSTMNISLTEAVLDQSDEGMGVEKRALRKRTITVKAAFVGKSKRLCKHDHDVNDGQTAVCATTEDCGSEEPTVMEMTATENKTTDQGKGQESTLTGDMSKQAQSSEFLNVSEATDAQLEPPEEEKGEENAEEQPVAEKVMESENSAGEADEVADDPRELEETEQREKNAEGIEASATVDENFTLELDEEINSSEAECHQVSRESEKGIPDAEQEAGVMIKSIHQGRKSETPAKRLARRSRRLLHESQSEMEKLGVGEVKEVAGEEEKKPKKRKAVAELTPRRSKRLGKEEIV